MLRDRLTILTYHRVLAKPDPMFPDEIDAGQFHEQLRMLARYCNVIDLSEGVLRLRERTLPRFAVSITFDDGYADNVSVGLPVLERHGLPATFFIATGYLNGGLMWNDVIHESMRAARGESLDLRDRDLGSWPLRDMSMRRDASQQLIERLKYLDPGVRSDLAREIAERAKVSLPSDSMMTDDDVRSLHKARMGIGAHTVTHPILARLPAAAAQSEIVESRRRLQELLDTDVTLFAYPNGRPDIDYRAEHVKYVADAGFTAAVSTRSGTARPTDNPYELPRIGVWDPKPGTFALRTLYASLCG